ncbi:GH25 family lysozyme [Corynebacterium parakroppenstedtii]|uniref:GH25 family lysozyme n=1 Tax=Corynebacterium parakroppenstedtii TaxID=2828363 RepID=UPI002F266023
MYTYKYFWMGQMNNSQKFSDMPLWLAAYQDQAPEAVGGWNELSFWQRSGSGKVAGISTDVDMNLFNGSKQQLQSFSDGNYVDVGGALEQLVVSDGLDLSSDSTPLIGAILALAAGLIAIPQLADAADKPIADYSAGMTKKILLAGALLHNPEVVILDEPLEAVDPVSGQLIQELLRAYAARGGTVILSSHVMQLVEGLCDHVAIIAGGQVLSAGHVEEVRQGGSLTDAFIHFAGGSDFDAGSFDWLRREGGEPQRGEGEA